MTAEPVVVEATFKAPLDKVWKAITDSGEMRQWFFDKISDFKPQRGFATSFNVHHESTDYLHQWTVTEVVPKKKVEYRWRYGGVPGDSTVTWNLSETPQGTKLRLTHAGIESFPQENPAFRRDSCQGGWEYFIRDRLQNYLDG